MKMMKQNKTRIKKSQKAIGKMCIERSPPGNFNFNRRGRLISLKKLEKKTVDGLLFCFVRFVDSVMVGFPWIPVGFAFYCCFFLGSRSLTLFLLNFNARTQTSSFIAQTNVAVIAKRVCCCCLRFLYNTGMMIVCCHIIVDILSCQSYNFVLMC